MAEGLFNRQVPERLFWSYTTGDVLTERFRGPHVEYVPILPVRECLRNLVTDWPYSKPCWCPDFWATEEHIAACEVAQSLYAALEAR